MPEGHGFFSVFNRTANPVIKAALRSPAHRLLDRRLVLISVIGVRSGRVFTFPVSYRRDGDRLEIVVGWPERKRWWRNLRDGARVGLRLRGEDLHGWAQARGDEESGVVVEVRLDPDGAAA